MVSFCEIALRGTALACGPATWLARQAREMLSLLGVAFEAPEQQMIASPRPLGSPGRSSSGGGDTGRECSVAQKTLPIRKESSIDPALDNPKVGELQKGDFVFILERREEEDAGTRVVRAS